MDAKFSGTFFILLGISGIINAASFSWPIDDDDDYSYYIYDYLKYRNFPNNDLGRNGLLKLILNRHDSERFNTILKKIEMADSKTNFAETSLNNFGITEINSKALHLESRSSRFQTPTPIILGLDHTVTSTSNSQMLQNKLKSRTEEVMKSSDRTDITSENFSLAEVSEKVEILQNETEIVPSKRDHTSQTTDNYSPADKISSTTDEYSSPTDENYSTADQFYSTADENYSTTEENYSTTEENYSTTDENHSTTDENYSTADENYSTADENSSTAAENSSTKDYKTTKTGGITKSETDVTKIPMSSDISTDQSPTSNLIELKTSTQFPNIESSSPGEEIASTSLAPSREPITDFTLLSSTIEEVSIASTTIKELTDGTTASNSISGSTESVSPKNEHTTIAEDHIIRISSIRTARMIVSVIFIVIALVAATILAVYIFTVKRRGIEYDQLLLLH